MSLIKVHKLNSCYSMREHILLRLLKFYHIKTLVKYKFFETLEQLVIVNMKGHVFKSCR